MQGYALALNQPLGALDIMCGSGMLKSFNFEAVVFVPLAGADVQFVDAALRIAG